MATESVTEQLKAEHFPCDNASYHEDTEYVTNSMKESVRKSPSYFHGRYIAKTITPDFTDALLIGGGTHVATIEPELFESTYAVAPKCDRRTNVGKDIWERFQASSGGKQILTVDQYDLVMTLRDALLGNAIARELLTSDGEVEFTIRWQDRIKRKCRFDKLAGDIIPDIKTCADPGAEAFTRQALNLGYHRQADWYMDGFWAFYGREPRFVFLAVGKEPPHDVCPVELDAEFLDLGARQNERAIERLAQCYATGDWSNPQAKQVTVLSPPGWARNSDQWEV